MLTNLVNVVTNKPWVSVAVTQSAFCVSLLSWLQFLTPIIGFIAAIFGLIVGYFSLVISYRKYRDYNKKRKQKIHPLHKV